MRRGKPAGCGLLAVASRRKRPQRIAAADGEAILVDSGEHGLAQPPGRAQSDVTCVHTVELGAQRGHRDARIAAGAPSSARAVSLRHRLIVLKAADHLADPVTTCQQPGSPPGGWRCQRSSGIQAPSPRLIRVR